VISRVRAGRYNQRGVKLSTRIEERRPGSFGAGQPGFSESFRAFDEEFDYVCRSMRRHGVGRGDAEDLAQDVLIVAWRRWRDYDRGRPLRPWLAGIAARVARDFLKRRRREVPQGQIDLVAPGLTGEDQIESSRTRVMMQAALAALPDRHRVAIELYDLQGLAPHEIAQAMGVPMATAYTRLRRAHLAFARELGRLRKGRVPGPRRLLVPLLAAAAIAIAAVGLSARPGSSPSPVLARASPDSLRVGLVGYWPFDDGAGSAVARDRSGRGHHCVLRELDPLEAWTEGVAGGALDLRRGGWLECPQPPVPEGAAPAMTVMVRVKAALDGEGHSAVVTREVGPAHDDLFFFGFRGDQLKVSSRIWLGWVTRPIPGAHDRWTHIAFTRRAGGPTRLYVDGAEVGENQQGERAIAGEAAPLLVGGGHVGLEGGEIRQHFAGLVDELAVYDRALRPDEIALAAARAPLTL
jgi:RNA polymerase sigma-70 factor (ECF subfamily)